MQFDRATTVSNEHQEGDFFTKQARLQIEARMALAQAKDIAHMHMEVCAKLKQSHEPRAFISTHYLIWFIRQMERQKQKESPITEIIRNSLQKVGVVCPPEKRRVSRQMLTDMNIAQLQVIVNDLHTQIERLNEKLVQYLMERDELHMSQDSMLVDIEDLTRYLWVKNNPTRVWTGNLMLFFFCRGAKEQNQEKPASDKKSILMMTSNCAPTQQNRYAPRNFAK